MEHFEEFFNKVEQAKEQILAKAEELSSEDRSSTDQFVAKGMLDALDIIKGVFE